MMRADNLTFKSLDNSDVVQLINATRKGVDYEVFNKLSVSFPLNSNDWSRILNVSERTMQRYKREKRRFDSIHTERLLLIMLLFKKGTEVFGSNSNFTSWINSESIALGGIKPINLLDNSFGINMVRDELTRIEHGILA
jgi:putative toxin-antitoxin system antitoxin component (TIGR02293 family)